MEDSTTDYLNMLLPEQPEWVQALETLAKQDHVPIMDPLSMRFLQQLIKLQKPARILEIGTAIGYSALQMLTANPDAHIVTVERDSVRYEQAMKHINEQGKQSHISVHFGDVFDKQEELLAEGPYDMVFIDAAKGQYQRFFTLFQDTVPTGGVIISDNVLFRGFVAQPDQVEKKRMIKLTEKIRHYNTWLMQHDAFTTQIIPIGDGVAISVKC